MRDIPVHQMLGSARLQGMFLGNSHVDDPPLVVRVDQLVRPLPLPVGGILLGPLPVHPGDEAGDWDPEYQGDHYHGPDHIVLQKLEEAAHADLVNEVPDPDNVLTSFLAESFVTEALEARCAVRQDVHRSHRVTGAVEVPPAAPFTGVSTTVTHTGLLALGLTERNTLPGPALALLYTVGAVSHVLGLGTLGADSSALGLLLAGGVVGGPALGIDRHVLAVVTAGRVLVAADGVFSELTVLVAADISVLGPEQPGVTLLVPLHSEVPAEGLLGFSEAPRGLGQEDLPDEPQRAGRELLVVDVVPGDAVRVHEIGSSLTGAGTALRNVRVVL